jgi:hypothetical protein
VRAVRQFVQRLAALVARANLDEPIARNHRRVLIPEAGKFSLEGTIVRSLPFEPVVPFARPGGPSEVPQLLEWMDIPDEGERSPFADNDLGVDLTAMLALATGRRVAFANEVTFALEGAEWTGFLEIGHSVDGELYGPAEPGARDRFVTIAKAIVALPEDRAIALGDAIRMRNAACCLVETDHSSAYGLLIAALETLSRAFGTPPTSWHDWDQAEEWDRFFLDISLSDQQAESLRQRLLANRQLRLRRTFVEYAAGNLPVSFWDRPHFQYTPGFVVEADGVRRSEGTWHEDAPMSVLVPQDADELRRRLGRSYDARSEVFHASTRLDQIIVMPVPGRPNQPLPFAGLRRILDHLLWLEIEKGATDAPDLPDFQVVAWPDSSEVRR